MADILARDGVPLAVNQVEYSLLRQLPEKSGLLEEMKKRDITCLACEYPCHGGRSAYNVLTQCRLPVGDGPLDGQVQRGQPPSKGQEVSLYFHCTAHRLLATS